VNHEPALPFASSLCGACAEVCPVKIDIPKMLLYLRADVKKAEAREGRARLERLAFRIWAWVMRHPRIYELAGMAVASLAPSREGAGWIREVSAPMNVPPVKLWLSQRDLPPAPAKSFRQMWRER
jgi:L-lactate dehydrogenase complex protein LldF